MDDDGTLAIATPRRRRRWRSRASSSPQGIAPADAQGPLIATLFNEGKAGDRDLRPWFVADIAPTCRGRSRRCRSSATTGKPAAPFVGAEGMLMSARAKDKDAAFAVMDYLTGDAAAIVRAKAARQVVPNLRASDDPAVANDPTLAVFRAQLAAHRRRCRRPAMRMVWTPYQTALGEVLAGRAEPVPLLASTTRSTSYVRTAADDRAHVQRQLRDFARRRRARDPRSRAARSSACATATSSRASSISPTRAAEAVAVAHDAAADVHAVIVSAPRPRRRIRSCASAVRDGG